MANQGGTNGTVLSITTTATGSAVKVSFPGPPPTVDTYDPCVDPYLRRFEHADAGNKKVDVTVDGAGNPTVVKSHA